MFSLSSRLGSGIAAFALAPCAMAQSPNSPPPSPAVQQMSTIVVTPARTAEPLAQTLGDNTVVNRIELDSTPSASFAEVLGRQHGIDFINYGGPQTVSSVNVRGTNSNQTLVLIDGLRVNNATNGLPALNAIPLNSIERVEIVRGSGSSLYGADAIGGVINVITRGEYEQPFTAYANAGVGSYATSQYDAGFSGASNGWTYSLYGGYGQSAGFNATKASNYYANPDMDTWYRSNAGGQLGYTWMPGQTVIVQAYQSSLNGGYDMGRPYFNDRGVQTLSSTSITSKNRINDTWTSTLRASYLGDNYETKNAPASLLPGNPEDGKQRFRTNQNQYTWQNDFKLSPTQVVTLAYDRLEQRVDGNLSDDGWPSPMFVNYQQTSQYTNSYTGIYRGTFGIHNVQASLRNDDNSQYGNFVTGGLTYGIDITPAWRATVGANTGFRAPNFNELYWPVTAFYVGNPNLSPEKSRNAEIGLRYAANKGEYGIVAYYNQISNLIINQPIVPGDPWSMYTPSNVDKAIIKGITLTGSQRIHNTVLRGSFDLMSPRNEETGALLPQRAQRVFKFAADQYVGDLKLTAEWFLTSERTDSMDGGTLGGYGLVNLALSYAITPKADVQFRWNNILDKSYTLVQGYNTPGSNVFVNLAWRM